MEKLPENLDEYAALAIYFHHKSITVQALNTFDDYISKGGGVLAVHSATASFKDSDRFTDILGGKFTGHGPVETFTVTPVSPQSKIFQGIHAFRITDELYFHDLQPDIETHFTAMHEGQQVPMVWTRIHGVGRVCYACPGHRAKVFKDRIYQEVLIRGLKWVSNHDT